MSINTWMLASNCDSAMTTHLGEGFTLVGAETSSRVPQRDAVDDLGRGRNAKQLMHAFFHHGM
jgi:hypothetical protein